MSTFRSLSCHASGVPQVKASVRKRSDAALNRAHILKAAGSLLKRHPTASMAAIAKASNVARGTLYKHFPTRADLLAAVNDEARTAAAASSRDALRPAGELARATPSPMSVADVLNKVPPHLLGDQIVAEAQRIAGVTSAAVYLVDLNGVQLRRFAGPPSFPRAIPTPSAVGTEIPREGIPAVRAAVDDHLPGAASAPLVLRGRALGVLVAVGNRQADLQDLAYEAAAALELADRYTDALRSARRTRSTSPAAEIQQNLLPPRIVRTNGALIAGNVLPGYEIGGDWFDYAENAQATWLGIADATGTGPRAAALSAIALGAFRSARHDELGLIETVQGMDAAVRAVSLDGGTVTTTIAQWVPPTSTFSWITCGEIGPVLIAADGTGEVLPYSTPSPLGDPSGFTVPQLHSRRLADNDRVALVSDGVLERTSTTEEVFGSQGVIDAVRDAPVGSAAGAVRSIEATLHTMNESELVDDATVVVLVPVLMGDPDLGEAPAR